MNESIHQISFPGESETYRTARNELLRAELKLRDQVMEVAKLRQGLPAGGPVKEDYVFDEGGAHLSDTKTVKRVKLSELFEPGKDSLILYSFMYAPENETACIMCNSILDGLNGAAEHIRDRVNFAVVAKSPVGRIREWGAIRRWNNLRLLSSQGNTYNADYHAQTPDSSQIPALNVFTRGKDGISHFYALEVLYSPVEGQPRHADLLWPVWNMFDLTPEGRGTDWYPKLAY